MRNTTNYYKFRQKVTPAAMSQIESGPQQIGNLCSSHGFRLHFDAGENIYALETPSMVDMYPIRMEQLLTKAFPSCIVMNYGMLWTHLIAHNKKRLGRNFSCNEF